MHTTENLSASQPIWLLTFIVGDNFGYGMLPADGTRKDGTKNDDTRKRVLLQSIITTLCL